MNAQPLSDAEMELQRCEEEAQRLEQIFAEASELPRRMALEKQERDCTLPPCPRLAEIQRKRAHAAEIETRWEKSNVLNRGRKSLLLAITLGVACLSLVAWGFRLMNG
jgi:hypothetical protein